MFKIKKIVKRFVSEKKVEGFLDVAIKILIVVVIGAVILLILNAAMLDLLIGASRRSNISSWHIITYFPIYNS